MKGKIYNTVSLLLGLGTLAILVYKIGYRSIWLNVLQTGVWFVPVIGSWLIIYVLNALAFREIIYERKDPQTRFSFLTVLRITVSGYAINNITPFLALGGEPYRIMQLRKQVSAPKAASSVLLYYIMHVLSHIVFWMVSIVLILIFLRPAAVVAWGCVGAFALFCFLLAWAVKQYEKGLLKTSLTALQRLPFVKKHIALFAERKKEDIAETDRHIHELFSRRPGSFYASLFLEFLGRVVGCFEIYFIALALQVDVSFADAFIISAGSSLFANLVFFTPMQLGSREGGFVLALASIGLEAGVGLFMSLATRIRELVWIFIGLIMIPVRAMRR